MSQENVERLRPALLEWEQGNFAAGSDLFSPDVLLTTLIPSGGVVRRGREEIVGYLREFFEQWRDYRINVETVEPVGESAVVMEGRQLGVGASSGVEVDESMTVVFMFDGDQVAAMHWYPLRTDALEAAGLSE